jgi:hypothetical protein
MDNVSVGGHGFVFFGRLKRDFDRSFDSETKTDIVGYNNIQEFINSPSFEYPL